MGSVKCNANEEEHNGKHDYTDDGEKPREWVLRYQRPKRPRRPS